MEKKSSMKGERKDPEAATVTGLQKERRAETWSIPTVETKQTIDRLYLRDATLSSDHRSIVRSTIAGIEGSGGPITMRWNERST